MHLELILLWLWCQETDTMTEMVNKTTQNKSIPPIDVNIQLMELFDAIWEKLKDLNGFYCCWLNLLVFDSVFYLARVFLQEFLPLWDKRNVLGICYFPFQFNIKQYRCDTFLRFYENKEVNKIKS